MLRLAISFFFLLVSFCPANVVIRALCIFSCLG